MSDPVFVHSSALCETTDIGPGSRVDAFAAVAVDCILGDDCTIGAGAHILSGALIGSNAVVGANAVVGRGIAVSRGAVIEPGSVVTDPVPANAIVRGNPARIVGYVGGDPDHLPTTRVEVSAALGNRPTRVRGVSIYGLTRAHDLRGSLMAVEFADLPFVPVRVFSVSGVPGEHIRGSHAHRECAQLLICVSGSLSCVADDGESREEVRLDSPDFGLYTPAMTWNTQYKYSPDAALLVLASHPYDPFDYIRDYDEFLRLARSPGADVRGEVARLAG
jgi:UDP-2-acetamido-3-amino-2,3-dideoxy-glucuronate N-acetyltransferase